MAGLPTIQVLLDNGTGSFPYDITSKARVQYGLSRGRQDEMSSVTPGQISLLLDNNDGRFTAGSTIIDSPSPILVSQRIRVKVTADGVTRDRFTGYVQQWPIEWPSGSDVSSLVSVVATDAQARAERQPLGSTLAEDVLTEDSPNSYYELNETQGASAAGDTSGNQRASLRQLGTGPAVEFGSGAATFAAGKYLNNYAGVGQGLAGSGFPWGFMVAFTTTASGSAATLAGDSAASDTLIGIDASGHLTCSAGAGVTSAGTVNDGALHIAHVVSSSSTVSLYLDGVLVGSGTQALWLFRDGINFGQGFTGTLSDIASFFPPPNSTRIAAHADAALTGFAGESGTDRITRIAGYVNIPVGTLDASLTDLAGEDSAGQRAAAELTAVADAEVGLVFVDGSGNVTFHNRNRAPSKAAPDITIGADVIDPSAQFDYDAQGLVNYCDATAAGTGATQVVRNAASETRHGRYPDSRTYLVQTDAEALDRANWIVANHADPAPRLGSMPIDLMSLDAATQSALLAAEPNTWIRVTDLPSQTPGGTTQDFSVQGFTESLTKDSWSITFNVISRSLVTAWILEDATYGVLDSTTRLYV